MNFVNLKNREILRLAEADGGDISNSRKKDELRNFTD